MQKKKILKTKGFSLTDSITAAVMLGVVVAGAGNYKYFAVRDAVRAERQIVSARTALFFCEAWRGASGSADFEPEDYFEDIVTLEQGSFSNVPEGYRLRKSHDLIVEGQAMNVTLSWKDIDSHLRALNVAVTYSQDVQPSANEDEDEDEESIDLSGSDESFSLTTYCQITDDEGEDEGEDEE